MLRRNRPQVISRSEALEGSCCLRLLPALIVPPLVIGRAPRTDDPDVEDSWYAWFTNGQGNEIIATYNYHRHRGTDHTGERHNAYYMVMDTEDVIGTTFQGNGSPCLSAKTLLMR